MSDLAGTESTAEKAAGNPRRISSVPSQRAKLRAKQQPTAAGAGRAPYTKPLPLRPGLVGQQPYRAPAVPSGGFTGRSKAIGPRTAGGNSYGRRPYQPVPPAGGATFSRRIGPATGFRARYTPPAAASQPRRAPAPTTQSQSDRVTLPKPAPVAQKATTYAGPIAPKDFATADEIRLSLPDFQEMQNYNAINVNPKTRMSMRVSEGLIHSGEAGSPRRQVHSLLSQQGRRPSQYIDPNTAGLQMLAERWGNKPQATESTRPLGPDNYGPHAARGRRSIYMPGERWLKQVSPTNQRFYNNEGYAATKNHELEHAVAQPTSLSPRFVSRGATDPRFAAARARLQSLLARGGTPLPGEKQIPAGSPAVRAMLDKIVAKQDMASNANRNLELTSEVAPVVGDTVFRAEQFRRDEGKRLKGDLHLPSESRKNKSHDIDWMRQQAKRHGYFDGRSMQDLLINTAAGRQWLQQMMGTDKWNPDVRTKPDSPRPSQEYPTQFPANERYGEPVPMEKANTDTDFTSSLKLANEILNKGLWGAAIGGGIGGIGSLIQGKEDKDSNFWKYVGTGALAGGGLGAAYGGLKKNQPVATGKKPQSKRQAVGGYYSKVPGGVDTVARQAAKYKKDYFNFHTPDDALNGITPELVGDPVGDLDKLYDASSSGEATSQPIVRWPGRAHHSYLGRAEFNKATSPEGMKSIAEYIKRLYAKETGNSINSYSEASDALDWHSDRVWHTPPPARKAEDIRIRSLLNQINPNDVPYPTVRRFKDALATWLRMVVQTPRAETGVKQAAGKPFTVSLVPKAFRGLRSLFGKTMLSTKTAMNNTLQKGLIGAGVGAGAGVLGHAVAGDEGNFLRNVGVGALAGGGLGAVYGGLQDIKRKEYKSPAVEVPPSPPTKRDVVSKYYSNAPGGVDAAEWYAARNYRPDASLGISPNDLLLGRGLDKPYQEHVGKPTDKPLVPYPRDPYFTEPVPKFYATEQEYNRAASPAGLKSFAEKLKREYVQETGKHIKDYADARRALKWWFERATVQRLGSHYAAATGKTDGTAEDMHWWYSPWDTYSVETRSKHWQDAHRKPQPLYQRVLNTASWDAEGGKNRRVREAILSWLMQVVQSRQVDTGVKQAAGKPFTVAVDLDGTLAKDGPFDADNIPEPIPGVKKQLSKFQEAGAKLIINTVRGDKQQIAKWLDKNDIPFDHINENPDQPEGASDKPIADIYLDDRAVNAARPPEQWGQEILEKLKEAKPDKEDRAKHYGLVVRTQTLIIHQGQPRKS